MKKVPTLFLRDPANPKYVIPEVDPRCEWVLAGEGTATCKFDGICVLIRDGAMFARQQVKEGGTPPPNFEPVDHDEATGKTQGWAPVTHAPEWARHWEAWERASKSDGTYELIGPKVNGNPEGHPHHALIPHGVIVLDGAPRDFVGLHHYLLDHPYEGIVWWREPGSIDAGVAKLKRRDFPRERP